jgi:catechol 2,3-dioxygenase-like lactoylglutathione lyase family enzyme
MARNLDSFLPKSEQTPLDVGIPVFWMDASDSRSYIKNGSGEVLGGVEKSPFAGRFGQDSPGGTAPVMTTINGRSAFIPNDGFRSPGANIPKNEVVVFIVFSDNDGTLLENSSSDIVFSTTASQISGADGGALAELADDEAHIMLATWDVVSGDLFVKFDDQDGVVVDNDTSLITSGVVSERWFAGVTTGGTVGEVIVYANSLNTLNLNRLGKYLCTKWNLLWSGI